MSVIHEALDFRLTVEPIASGFAARYATAQDLETIEAEAAAAVRAENEREFEEHNAAFHAAVCAASQNRFFGATLEQIMGVLEEVLEVLPDSPAWLDSTFTEHATIVKSIVAGDDRKATEAMRDHIERTDVGVRAVLKTMQDGSW